MRIGCVADNLSEAVQISQFGYAYLELKGHLLLGSDTQFADFSKQIEGLPIHPEVITSPLPRPLGLKIVGPNADQEQALRVMEQLIPRAVALGVQVMVFGCGQARFVEAGFPLSNAHQQLELFLRRLADLCQRYPLLVAIETLNRSETNLLNSTLETRGVVQNLNCPEIRMLIDYHHILAEELPLDGELLGVHGYLIHAHTADPGRKYPGSSPHAQKAFLNGLRQLGYNDRLSVECEFSDFTREAHLALASLQLALHD